MDETPSKSPQGEPPGDKGDAPSPEDQGGLIERIMAGEVELFVKLIQPHEKMLHAVSHSILQNDADAEEVVQETFLKALAHLDQLRNCQCFRGWLLQITVNEARKRLREQRLYSSEAVECEKTEADRADFVPRDFTDWRDLPSLSLERKELWTAVSRALRSLDGIYREVVVLRDMQHLTVSQAAMILGISEACVRTRLHRARLQLREQLAPLFGRPRTG
jgi:RNA polymerase sigma-70 factor (ECF subfamily)